MTDRARRLNLATWHVREAYLKDADGRFRAAEDHIGDAREFFRLATGRAPRGTNADELTAEIEEAKDMQL